MAKLSGLRGKITRIVAVNPETVCCEQALLACALLSVGVREHPQFPFRIYNAELNGRTETRWLWVFTDQSACGSYQTADLVRWWNDDAWCKANATHEWAVLRAGLRNMAEIARRIRTAIPRNVITRGQLTAFIPVTASEARTKHFIGQLDGTIPFDQDFVEPQPTSAA